MTSGADLDRLRSLQGIKWSKFGDDVIAAWVADMDFALAPVIADAVGEIMARGDLGYYFGYRSELAELFCQWQADHHGWSPDPRRVRVSCDVLSIVETVIYLRTKPGDGIVLFTPIYPPFRAAATWGGRRAVECPLSSSDGWRMHRDRLRSVIDDTTRIILLSNPHNPTGRVFDHDELAAVAAVAEEFDLLVISDEIWADLVHPEHRHVPLASIGDEIAARTITPTAASKAFNLAGMRCAVAHVGSEQVWRAMADLPPHLMGATSTLGAAATAAAWRDGEPWLDETRRHLTDQRNHLAARLAAEAPEVGYQPGEATYLAWLDFNRTPLAADPAGKLQHESGLALNPGPDFGVEGAGWARLNFATSGTLLDEAIDRIVAALASA